MAGKRRVLTVHERQDNATVVIIGDSPSADGLRRSLVRRGVDAVGVSGRLAGLRRAVVRGEVRPSALCVSLDRSTLDVHGRALRTLIADRQALPCQIRCLGLVTRSDAVEVMTLGCDVYLQCRSDRDGEAATRMIELMSRVPATTDRFGRLATDRLARLVDPGIRRLWLDCGADEWRLDGPPG